MEKARNAGLVLKHFVIARACTGPDLHHFVLADARADALQ